MNIELVRKFIQQNGHHASGYYKRVNFKTPVEVLGWNEYAKGYNIRMVATGMSVEDDVAPCGHYCEEPFVDFSDGSESRPISGIAEHCYDRLESALSEGDAGPDKWGN